MALADNKAKIQALLAGINALPDAGSGGVELPTLSNPAVAVDIVAGKEAIDGEGNVLTGTNPYEKTATDEVVADQTELITQIKTALDGKAAGGGGSGGSSTVTLTFEYTRAGLGSVPYSPLVRQYATVSIDGKLSAEVFSDSPGSGGKPNDVSRLIPIKTGQIIVLVLDDASSTSLTVSGGVSLIGTADSFDGWGALAVFSVASDGAITAISK